MSLLTELSKKWNLSLNEVKKIQHFMNEHYHLAVFKSQANHKFYGCLCEMRPLPSGNLYPFLSVSVEKPFNTADEAARFLNEQVDTWEMPKMRAHLMDVPQDAYRLLTKLPVKTKTHTKNKSIQSQHVKA